MSTPVYPIPRAINNSINVITMTVGTIYEYA